MTVIASAVTVVRRRTWNSQHTKMRITVSDTCVLGNELLIALSGRIESISVDVHWSDSRMALDSGYAQRSGTGNSRNHGRLMR